MRRVLAVLGLAVALIGGGCNVVYGPGERCTPNESECVAPYYCAVGGVCTRLCQTEADCRVACTGGTDGEPTSGCPTGLQWSCVSGTCACEGCEPVLCVDGYCRRDCPTCTKPDPYAQRD